MAGAAHSLRGMDWGNFFAALVGGGLGGAVIAGVVSLVNNGRQLKRVDEQLAKIDQPRLQIEQQRFEMERTAEPRAREREAYMELLNAFHDMTEWLNEGIDSSPATERTKHELLAKYNRAAAKVVVDGHANVHYFAVDTARAFQAYVHSVLMEEPSEALWDRFVNGQTAVQSIVKHRLQGGSPPAETG